MTTDDIIRMAKEAGLEFVTDNLEEFSNLVAAAEREACAKVCEEIHWCYDDREWYAAAIRARGQE